MDNFFRQETALLACLNDNQSLKKRENIDYFRDPASIRNIFTDIFENYSSAHRDYPEVILPVIEKAEVAREKQLLDHYIDVIKRYRQKSIHILQVTDRDYPLKLARIPDPPFMIYIKGRMESLSRPAVAIVGTRDISPDGAEKVQEIVGFFVQLGYTIVSGLALGTDACAHKAALDLGGETIAVLPGDIENVVPKENQELAERISKSGALISEITLLTKMHRGRYIERNRITSALSKAVIVIETGESGGSIRQAETAFKQGTPVYVVRPDNTNERAVAGFDKLVSEGATPINNLYDLSAHFGKAQNTTSRMTTLADFS
ncbi:MAG: DNA-protecting protein DprA [Methanomicrobiales archaeon HGW-Methanomicrobiales-2]|jgi:DNA processing protein|nr:MAG: DNA-protecting protein DprA [Methanomicrobiales archaeon HGW-Methanomicrobiales-5]PKL63204.1 MAG: DNA-protecting protein DprA [Methanomicrobiales archaeon HGW-Methanomicrobiales-2]